jgi:hypothetical protein
MSTQDPDTDDGTDLEINVDLAAGMRVEVEYEDTRPAYAYERDEADDTGMITTTMTDTGVITAVTSTKFHGFGPDCDFDYRVEVPGDSDGTTRSVSFADERVYDLHYHAGGDWDAAMFDLVSISVIGVA